jgi:polyhydroxybutyrate depolymerase
LFCLDFRDKNSPLSGPLTDLARRDFLPCGVASREVGNVRIRRWLIGGALGAGALLLALAWMLRIVPPAEPELPGTWSDGSLRWEGRERAWRMYRPSWTAGGSAIVMVLHGSMGDAEDARAMTAFEFERLAEDVGFLRALVARLSDDFDADPNRVFATGISNGGHMAIRLALEAPDLVQAIAPIVAALPSGDNLGCEPSGEGVAIFLINGSEDPMNPYEGGRVALYGVWGDRGTVHSTEETIAYFARISGYEGPALVRPLPDLRSDDDSFIVEHRWAEPERPEIVLWAVMGGGHTMPHPTFRWPRLLGATNADTNAPEAIWEFFDRSGSAVGPKGKISQPNAER